MTRTKAKSAADATRSADSKVRLDRWLWAARFFKTRSLAKTAIDGGKVHCNGVRAKASRDVRPGDELQIRQGYDEVTVHVTALAEKRGSATIARTLYEETPQSIAARERAAQMRRLAHQGQPAGRPSKKDRRQIHRFRNVNENE